jgi:two-component system, chemotaxis family, chemotaxis protein CheY
MVTTESSPTRIKELLSEGVRDYLHKPFTPEEFRSVISRHLGACHDRS